MVDVKIKKLYKYVKTPYSGSDDAAGRDIFAFIPDVVEIPPHTTKLINTGFCTEFPKDVVAKLYSRSGLAVKGGLVIAQGVAVIDADYRGEWMIPIHNDTNEIKKVEPYDRICQVIFEKFETPNFIETDELSETHRGAGGFGSSGK